MMIETSETVARWNELQRVIRQRDALLAALRDAYDDLAFVAVRDESVSRVRKAIGAAIKEGT